MKEIQLTNGGVALVDDDDYERLSKFRWRAASNGHKVYYAERFTSHKSILTRFYMHREIMNCPEGMYVDHINRDGLDNRKENLRICTMSQNNRNVLIYKTNKTGYKGVSFDKSRGTYRAIIHINNKSISLGRFHTAEEAARAYDKAAKDEGGEFSVLNFPESETAK